ncbi:type II toxin-antitoxin system RelE/ParE family toxin [Ralstonia solanacearum]|uniref:type II toxin-antitoxin system RelE/ParE family toxin n=1 Tax=Ralstonia solanacearum TaxID=305 RepID=UPI0018D1BEFF|nr:type II toxin-antitoxin system RelE/ParE family toxin [Ralstonia solanacearum]
MRVAAVIQDAWTIYELLNARDEGVLADLGADAGRCVAFLEHAAKHGPEVFAQNRTHHVSDDPKIWQFDVTGTLRLLYFYDAGRVIVLAKLFYKAGGKSGKTPRSLIKAAQSAYTDYLVAKENGTLEIVEGDDDEDQ